jgi:CspA family cold shock protein
MPKGTIKRLMDRGFGFIKTEEQEGDLFFHRNDIEDVEFASLREGQEVEFEMSQGPDGRFAAVKVRLAETQAETQADDSDDDKGDDDDGDDGGDTG